MSGIRLILVVGSDDFLLGSKVNELLNDLLPESERAFGLEIVDAAVETIDTATNALNQTRGALVQQGFFSESKTVWMKDVAFFESGRLGKSEVFSDEMQTFCEWLVDPGIPDGFTLLVSTPAAPKGGRFYKTVAALEKKGRAQIVHLSAPSPKDASLIVRETVEKRGSVISGPVAEAFVARVGYSPRVLMMEIEKLYLYTGGAAPTIEDVEAICTAQAGGEFWDLTDAFGQRDLEKTLKVLRNLFEKRLEPVFLIMQLQARLNEIYLINDSLAGRRLTSSGRWASGLSKELTAAIDRLGKFDISSKSPWLLDRLMSQQRNWTPVQLRHARKVMLTTHERMTSISVDSKALLEMAIADVLKPGA